MIRILFKYTFLLLLALLLLLVLSIVAFRWLPVPTSSFMLQSRTPVDYQWVDREQISPYMALAVVAAEDQRFPDHYGLDLQEIEKALYSDSGPPRGASTITQQVAKNLYLWGGRSYVRKGVEAGIALLIELIWSKERILEVYLNIAQFGDGVYGAEAASWRFFNRPAAALSQRQSALLAAVLPNPEIYRVENPQGWTLGRQRWILRQMQNLGGVKYLENLDKPAT
jgi:monofunctional biosynthetic peptidoglycan transglycosylase